MTRRLYTLLAAQEPIYLLLLLFATWKAFLFVLALSSPGPGYDTSTTLLQLAEPVTNDQSHLSPVPLSLKPLILKLVRWDAIYYTQVARRGHLFEQEWAFGVGFPRLISSVSTGNKP